MSHYLSFILPIFNLIAANRCKSQQTNSLEEQEQYKLAQLEDYLMADENQVVSSLSLYLYS
ncbi:hypothetical protein Sta7437_2594 [Stanieria cyanosphaera PCC 7437]|uniref:Uncharacterized protein n=1 Tax=Stanieria cyanosphaera (strain ATCC 29371 / PCC 7437) TaxID=111780 RepID=K9XU51_STAC7|nr:hypothetical protein [Stanieria cyanosphaera]AFZ36125.1 hypothetical protein Sta7437_2594 [Stanieria cyanosphaera PCC 7437]